MKRKATFGLTAAALVGAMCLGFAGCGRTNAKSIKGEEVTENEWNAALEYLLEDDAVYTISYRETRMGDIKGEYLNEILSASETSKIELKEIKNGGKEYIKRTEKVDLSGDISKIAAAMGFEEPEAVDKTEESYSVLEGGSYSVYTQDDGEWRTSRGSDPIIDLKYMLEREAGIPLLYEMYIYSSRLNGYILKESLQLQCEVGIIVKFDGKGRLAAVYLDHKSDQTTSYYERNNVAELDIVIEYDADEITLPTVD